MSFESLLIDSVVIRAYGAVSTNEYGDDVAGYTDSAPTPARVQPDVANEEEDKRDTSVELLRVFLPAGTSIGPFDLIAWDGDDWQVIGEPQRFSGALAEHHVELVIKRFKGG